MSGSAQSSDNRLLELLDATDLEGLRPHLRSMNFDYKQSRVQNIMEPIGIRQSCERNDRFCLVRKCAINRPQAEIELKLDGSIVTANQNFLDAAGNSLAGIAGSLTSTAAAARGCLKRNSGDFPKTLVNVEFHHAFIAHLQQEGLAVVLVLDVDALHDVEDRQGFLAQRGQYLFAIGQLRFLRLVASR
jgi:hypothetical protein